jgi:hypothetical protein
MKSISLVCGFALIIAVFNLPIGYYTLLRIVVTIGSVVLLIQEAKDGINFWVIVFALIGILFNPIIPVYINDKSSWIPIDIICAVIFFVKSMKS